MIGARITAHIYRWSRATMVAVILALTLAASSAYAESRIQSLNFVNAEIPVVLQALATATGSNIVIAPVVKGQISLRLGDMTVDEALAVITGMTDYSYRNINGTYVVNTAKALDDQYGVINQDKMILTLQKISPADAEAALAVMFKDIQVKTVDGRLLLVGSVARLKAAKAFIDQLDYTAGSITSTNVADIYQVVRLDNVTGADAEAALGVVFKDISVKSLKDGRVLLMGAPSRLKAAVSFLNILNGPTTAGVNPPAEISVVVTLRNMTPADAETAVSLAAKDIRAKGFTNGTILLLGSADRVQAAKTLLEMIDNSSSAVKTAPADDTIIYRLQALSKEDAISALGVVYKDVKAVYLPVDRLLLAGGASRLNDAVKFLKIIDTEKVTGADPIVSELVTLKYMRAADVAKALELPYKEVKSAAVGDAGNMVVLMGTVNDLKRAKNFLDIIDKNPSVEGNFTYSLQALTVTEATAAIKSTYKDLQITPLGANRIYLVGSNTTLDDVKTLLAKIDAMPPVPNATEVTTNTIAVVNLANITVSSAIDALGFAYKDITAKESNGRLLLVGPAKSVNAARALITSIDLPNPNAVSTGGVTTILESKYHIKSMVPAQVKQFLETGYGPSGLKVAYLPNMNTNWRNIPTAPGSAWTSNDILLTGPKNVIDQALALLATSDVEIPMAKVATSVKSISALHAINFLLGQYESQGLTIVTLPSGIFNPASTNPSIGIPVMRDATGKLNVAEPISMFELQGPKETVEMALASLKGMDTGPVKVIQPVTLRFIKVDDTKTMLIELYGKDGLSISVGPATTGYAPAAGSSGTSTPTGGGAAVAGASDNMSLQLSGPDDIVAKAIAKINELDIEPTQIQITATIASVNEGEVKNLGIIWSGVSGGVATPGGVTVNTNESQSSNALQLGRIIRDPQSFSTSLQALTSSDRAKIESRPSMTVQSGKETVFQAGGKIYYNTVTNLSNTGPVYTMNSIDTGVVMRVRPRATNDGIITLEITTSVSDTPTFRKDQGVDLPIISGNNCSTIVSVRDGEMLVIGGMIQTTDSVTRTAIPGLCEIPVIGGLFIKRTSAPQRKELLIIVQPNIIRYALNKANATGATTTVPAH